MGGSEGSGNANLPIGEFCDENGNGNCAIHGNGVPRNRKGAIRENGVPKNNKPANQEIGVPRGAWRSRGYLPHFEGADVTQHVTFHLGDSVAQATIQRLEEELKFLPDEKRDLERRKRLDAWLDAGHGSCVLREPDIAEMVQSAILHFDAERYRMLAWVVMPNHVHVLFQPIDGWTVAKIVASWKKFTAGKISQHRRDLGDAAGDRVWHREYWDRYIRDQRHFDKTVEYIHQNPVKAGLVAAAEQWIWSSAWLGVGDRKEKGKGDCKPANREIGVPRTVPR